MGNPCLRSCPFGRKCGLNITPSTLLRAHQRVYGTKTVMVGPNKWECAFSEAQTHAAWRQILLSCVTINNNPAAAACEPGVCERFLVEGQGPVCSTYCRRAYGFHDYTWNVMIGKARAGTLRAEEDAAAAGLNLSVSRKQTGTDSQSKFECVSWWKLWLRLEDQMPNEPTIVHRVVCWSSMYDQEYIRDIEWFGRAPSLSRERWVTLRKLALKELSVEFYGSVADCAENDARLTEKQRAIRQQNGGFDEPICKIGLKERAKHSNFAACDECSKAKQLWLDYRAQRARGEGGDLRTIEEIKKQIFKHLNQ
eukprot:6130778-Pleurochrysis_carterae.AAC.1